MDRATFNRGIARIEAARQENYSKETLSVWFDEMVRRKWTVQYFEERYNAVLNSKTIYGGLKFNDFIDASALFTKTEMIAFSQKYIQQRKEAISRIKFDEKELEEEGLIDLQVVYSRRREEEKKRLGLTLEQRVKAAEGFIRNASEEVKLEILAILHQKGKIGDDPHWREILRFFAADVLFEVEKMMKYNVGSTKVPEKCSCRKCNPIESDSGTRMFICVKCGNKRCPHASDHAFACTNSNEPGQTGSVYE